MLPERVRQEPIARIYVTDRVGRAIALEVFRHEYGVRWMYEGWEFGPEYPTFAGMLFATPDEALVHAFDYMGI